MNDARMTIRLPRETLAFAQGYAAQYGFTLTELVTRYFDRLKRNVASNGKRKSRRDIRKYAGLLKCPNITDKELDDLRYKYLMEKYA